MGLEPFPKASLVPERAVICTGNPGFDILIHIRPFVLDGESVRTAFNLDGVRLPADTRAWADRRFTFPRNPENGYVDGSIYLRHAHNPVDVTSIRFGERRGNSIHAEFFIHMDFEFEGTGFENTDIQISVPLEIADA
jgi:hypothetical protein